MQNISYLTRKILEDAHSSTNAFCVKIIHNKKEHTVHFGDKSNGLDDKDFLDLRKELKKLDFGEHTINSVVNNLTIAKHKELKLDNGKIVVVNTDDLAKEHGVEFDGKPVRTLGTYQTEAINGFVSMIPAEYTKLGVDALKEILKTATGRKKELIIAALKKQGVKLPQRITATSLTTEEIINEETINEGNIWDAIKDIWTNYKKDHKEAKEPKTKEEWVEIIGAELTKYMPAEEEGSASEKYVLKKFGASLKTEGFKGKVKNYLNV